jgi:hypothetical protein
VDHQNETEISLAIQDVLANYKNIIKSGETVDFLSYLMVRETVYFLYTSSCDTNSVYVETTSSDSGRLFWLTFLLEVCA